MEIFPVGCVLLVFQKYLCKVLSCQENVESYETFIKNGYWIMAVLDRGEGRQEIIIPPGGHFVCEISMMKIYVSDNSKSTIFC